MTYADLHKLHKELGELIKKNNDLIAKCTLIMNKISKN